MYAGPDDYRSLSPVTLCVRDMKTIVALVLIHFNSCNTDSTTSSYCLIMVKKCCNFNYEIQEIIQFGLGPNGWRPNSND